MASKICIKQNVKRVFHLEIGKEMNIYGKFRILFQLVSIENMFF